MLRIRLRRVGKKKQPMYRIVIADSHAARDGAFIENLGYYHPLDEPTTIVLDAERARHWLDLGAMPSDRVAKILAIEGIAEIPAKLKTRIALGEQRAKEAKKAKPEAKADEASVAEDEAKPEAKADEASAEDAEAEPEAKADDAPAAKDEAKPEAKADAAPDPEDAEAEPEAKAEEAPVADAEEEQAKE